MVRQERWLALWRDAGVGEALPGGAEVRLVPPDVESRGSFLNLPVGEAWPGWQLALFLKDDPMFAAATRHQTGIYLGTGVLVLAAMGVLTLLAIRLLRRQTALARLKSDLAAAVSHELKTPLASMRVLVDTLLNSDRWHEPSVREYLQLIAQENERLSRDLADPAESPFFADDSAADDVDPAGVNGRAPWRTSPGSGRTRA